jgi:hypothetical protein
MENPICALCGGEFTDFPALSRVDSQTEICSRCGWREACIPQTIAAFKVLWDAAPGKPKNFFKHFRKSRNQHGA